MKQVYFAKVKDGLCDATCVYWEEPGGWPNCKKRGREAEEGLSCDLKLVKVTKVVKGGKRRVMLLKGKAPEVLGALERLAKESGNETVEELLREEA